MDSPAMPDDAVAAIHVMRAALEPMRPPHSAPVRGFVDHLLSPSKTMTATNP